jgi:hypothetical protein
MQSLIVPEAFRQFLHETRRADSDIIPGITNKEKGALPALGIARDDPRLVIRKPADA